MFTQRFGPSKLSFRKSEKKDRKFSLKSLQRVFLLSFCRFTFGSPKTSSPKELMRSSVIRIETAVTKSCSSGDWSKLYAEGRPSNVLKKERCEEWRERGICSNIVDPDSIRQKRLPPLEFFYVRPVEVRYKRIRVNCQFFPAQSQRPRGKDTKLEVSDI